MTGKRALRTTEVLGGSRHAIGGDEFIFLDFGQPKAGAEPHSIAVPPSEVHKLAQIAIQAMPVDQRHELIATLVSLLSEPVRDPGAEYFSRVFGVDDWAIGDGDDRSVILTIGFGGGGGSLGFRLDRRKAIELASGLRSLVMGGLQRPQTDVPQHPFLSIAEDIEWLRDDWAGCIVPPTTAELRRASGTLRHLLLEGGLQRAWRFCGLDKGPRIVGPDLEALMELLGQDPRHSAVTLAAGVEIGGLACACVSLRRVYNPTTGKGPDADEGFAMEVGSVAKRVVPGEESPDTPLHAAATREWRSIERFMSAPGAVRRGSFFT